MKIPLRENSCSTSRLGSPNITWIIFLIRGSLIPQVYAEYARGAHTYDSLREWAFQSDLLWLIPLFGRNASRESCATCASCGGQITAERQKGHHYYRCTKKGRCREPYLRKESLLNEKIRLEESFAKLETEAMGWLEPCKKFLCEAHQAYITAHQSENLASQKNVAKKIGSNFRLAARRLSFEAAAPWRLLAKNPSDTSTLALLGARKAGPANFKNPHQLIAPPALDVKNRWELCFPTIYL